MHETARDDDPDRLDAVLELLASRWCRYVLYELRRDGSLPVAAVVRRVAAREYDDPDDDRRETVRTRLHHEALPKLEANDVVERDGAEVAIGEAAPLADPYVAWAKEWELDQ